MAALGYPSGAELPHASHPPCTDTARALNMDEEEKARSLLINNCCAGGSEPSV